MRAAANLANCSRGATRLLFLTCVENTAALLFNSPRGHRLRLRPLRAAPAALDRASRERRRRADVHLPERHVAWKNFAARDLYERAGQRERKRPKYRGGRR